MTKEQMRQAAGYWNEQEPAAVRMEPAALRAEMERYILAHNTCALATGAGAFVRCTPIEYNYVDGCFWLFTEGGKKFAALAENRNVCLAIFDPYQGFSTTAGMQVTGTAEVVEPWSEPYLKLLAHKRIDPAALKKQPHFLHLLRIVPQRVDFLYAPLKKQGYTTRQHLLWEEDA